MNSQGGLIEFLTVETLLNKSGIQFDPYHPEEWDKSLSVLNKFKRMRMIELYENGDIEIINWNKRQETNLTPAERAKSYRDRKKVVTNSSQIKVTNVTQEENRIDKNRIDKKGTVAIAPTLEQIESYCLEKNLNFDASKFFYYYESNGWKVGKNPMKNWKSAIASWMSKDKVSVKKDLPIISFKN